MKKRTRGKKRVDVTLNETVTPVFLIGADRRIEFFNSGCEQLTGWSASELLGTVANYLSDENPENSLLDHEDSLAASLAAALCPPPNVFSGEIAAVPAYLADRDGKTLPWLLNFFPLTDADGTVLRVVGIITEIEPPVPACVTTAQKLHAELAAIRSAMRQRYGLNSFIGNSEPMRRVAEQIEIARQSQSPVLLQGEKGTGKEHIARLIHNESELRIHSFVPVDCRELPAREIKSLFRRLLEPDSSAPSLPSLRPTTLLLSNVEELPRDLQQLIAEKWGSDNRPDIRLMAATTGDFREQFKAEELRSDFYYLMTTFEIALPSLRERAEEIDLFAQSFLEAENRNSSRQIGGFSTEVATRFREYRWPGNLDELQLVVSEAREHCGQQLIEVGDLPFRFRTGLDAQHVGPPVSPFLKPLQESLDLFETEQIQAALVQARENKTLAAKMLGLTRARLYRRMQSLGIADTDETGP
jgi:DNA-binding NtrC family response regulator